MRTSRALLLPFAVPAGMAVAGTQVYVESSVNGSAYAPSSNARPGDWVHVRVRVSESDPQSTVGFQGLTFKIGVRGVNDELFHAWSAPAASADAAGPGVQLQTGLGRVTPFSLSAPSAVPVVTQSGDMAVISGHGTGGRIVSGQSSPELAGTKYNSSSSPVIFRFGFTAGTLSAGDRTIRVTIEEILNQSATWHTSPTGILGAPISLGIDGNPGGTVTIVPTPGVIAVVGSAGAMLSGRRRRRA
jgi:hypothetical protein